ncbi:MAG: abortive phage infection protein [Coprobacillus sp.]|nr:abortive phage infection protein [Coprobacillus sp.]
MAVSKFTEERRQRLIKFVDSQLGDSFKYKQVKDAGFNFEEFKKLLDEAVVERNSKGIYTKTDAISDEFYLTQQKYEKGIYSYETALWLNGYSDRVPSKLMMSFPQGYNCSSIKDEPIIMKYKDKDIYDLGVYTIPSPYGNDIKVTNIERTLCDMLLGNKGDTSLVSSAMRQYVNSANADFPKLLDYADKLRVRKKIDMYLKILLF